VVLRTSAGTDWAVWPFAKGRRFDALAMRLFTQLPRYAMHRAQTGGGRVTSDANLGNGSQNELILAPRGREVEAEEPRDALQVC
jgi:hypothetical protein